MIRPAARVHLLGPGQIRTLYFDSGQDRRTYPLVLVGHDLFADIVFERTVPVWFAAQPPDAADAAQVREARVVDADKLLQDAGVSSPGRVQGCLVQVAFPDPLGQGIDEHAGRRSLQVVPGPGALIEDLVPHPAGLVLDRGDARGQIPENRQELVPWT
jgi:hypothetical protein